MTKPDGTVKRDTATTDTIRNLFTRRGTDAAIAGEVRK